MCGKRGGKESVLCLKPKGRCVLHAVHQKPECVLCMAEWRYLSAGS